jgi:uncharacterized repeat protein (TIGR03803 family)
MWFTRSQARIAALIAVLVGVPVTRASDTILRVHGKDGLSPYGGAVTDASGTIYGMTFNGGASNMGTVWARRPNGAYAVLHSFGDAGDGVTPAGTLVFDGAGFLYGATGGGGASSHGTVFKMKADGSSYQILHSFTGTTSDGAQSLLCPILVGSTFYGTALYGGASNQGVLYKLNTDGMGFGLVHSFAGGVTDGASPFAAPTYESGTGFLYGTAQLAGASSHGVVYKVKTDGGSYAVLHHFAGGMDDGALPSGGVVRDASGNLYGTTYNGGTPDHGVLYTLTTGGAGFAVLHTFTGGAMDGSGPGGPLLLQGSLLYGTTTAGGSAGAGTLFSIGTSGGGFAVLRSFSGTSDGGGPQCTLVRDARGHLLGTTVGGGAGYGVAFDSSADGQTYVVLHEFLSNSGTNPERGLVTDGAGNFYGTTNGGGAFGLGMVFKMKADGTHFTVLHNFQGGTTDGAYPQGTLALDSLGHVFGTTVLAGAVDEGTVFRIGTDGNGFVLLHSFEASAVDGAFPFAGVVWNGFNSKLYGTTHDGGLHNGGIVYALPTAGGSVTPLWSFDPNDNAHPGSASLMLDAATQYLYGTTLGTDGTTQKGNVYKVNIDGSVYLPLHAFQGSDGASPSCTLVADGAGYVYGTTALGGSDANAGTVFKMKKTDGTEFQTLHVFDGNDGGSSVGGLVRDGSGHLFGTTGSFGAMSAGTVFRIDESGSRFRTLHTFTGGLWDGSVPSGSLLLQGHTLVGTAYAGGWEDVGAEFAVFTCPSGDANGDGTVDVADVFFLINKLFAGGPAPPCTGDVNGDGVADVGDVFYLINFLFAGGPAPI